MGVKWMAYSGLLLVPAAGESSLGSAGSCSECCALLLLCRALALSKAGKYALLGQSTITTLAPGTDASMTCKAK